MRQPFVDGSTIVHPSNVNSFFMVGVKEMITDLMTCGLAYQDVVSKVCYNKTETHFLTTTHPFFCFIVVLCSKQLPSWCFCSSVLC